MVNRVRVAFTNFSWLIGSQIITSLCAFIWTILTARYLGVNDYGILGFAISFTGLFNVLADCGISAYIIRSVSADNSTLDKYLSNALVLKCLLSIFYCVVIAIAAIIVHTNYITFIICMLFAFESVFLAFSGLLNGIFQAYQKNKYQAISGVLTNILTLVFILGAIYLDLGLLGVTLSYIFANMISFLYRFIILSKKITKPYLQFDKVFCKNLLICGIPFALTGIFYIIYYQIDIVMLSRMVGDYATGMYNATYKLINVLTLFYSIYTAVVFPIMSKAFKSEQSLLTFSFEKSIKYLLLVTIPVALAMSYYASEIIFVIYGNQYAGADAILQVLIWTVCFLFVNGACSTLLNASHKEVAVTKIYILAAVFNCVVNFFLIPKYSYIGASVATVLSDILIFVLFLYILKKSGQFPSKHLFSDIGKIIVCSGVLAVVLIVFKLSIWIAIPVGIIVYLIAIYLTKTLDDDDKNIIRQIIKVG